MSFCPFLELEKPLLDARNLIKIINRTIIYAVVNSFSIVIHNFFYVPPGAGMILSKEDYNVLRRLNSNSSYENTFILNPWHMSPWSEGNWAGPVSERRTVFFRYNPGLALNWKSKTIDDEKAKWVFQNIDKPESYKLLKDWKITQDCKMFINQN